MKKVLLATLFLVSTSLLYTGCKKDDNTTADTTAPSIDIIGDNPDFSILNIAYVDQGADADDNVDDSTEVTATSHVNTSAAGLYTIDYDATDIAGNSNSDSRDVYVVDMNGSYSIKDTCMSMPSTNYTDNITVNNTSVIFSKFANYVNGSVNGTITGNNADGYQINIPSQTVNAGLPAANRNFSGTGTITFSKSGTTVVRTMIINYTEVTNGTTAHCTGTYIK